MKTTTIVDLSTPATRASLEYFASRERNQQETNAATLQRNLETEGYGDFPYGDVLAALREFEEAEAGELILGRGGYPTRFHWRVSLKDFAKTALGKQADRATPQDLPITLTLPAAEVERLAKYLKKL